MDETHYGACPVAAYGDVQLFAGFAYYVLSRVLVAQHGPESPLAVAVGRDRKGKLSVLIYALAVLVSFIESHVAFALYVLVAVIWLVPDRRIETTLDKRPE